MASRGAAGVLLPAPEHDQAQAGLLFWYGASEREPAVKLLAHALRTSFALRGTVITKTQMSVSIATRRKARSAHVLIVLRLIHAHVPLH